MPSGRIFYVAPDDNRPIGGIRVIYRHVELLCRHGYNASILHFQPGFRATWFESTAPITYHSQLMVDRQRDVIVCPEFRAEEAFRNFPGMRKVIFNQGYFLTFPDVAFNPMARDTPYRHPELAGVLVNSRGASEYLAYVFKDLPIHHVRLSVDPAMYYFQEEKKDQLAFMPRRNTHDLLQILNALKHRGVFEGLMLAPIENLPQGDAAKVLRESLFFLNVGMQEGFGLPAAEAMACGCAVVGYHGFGGREFMLPGVSFPVASGDVPGAARALESAIYQTWVDRTKIDILRRSAAAFIAQTYSPTLEEQELLAAWQKIIV